jgi:GT2 family glycosyltransferase
VKPGVTGSHAKLESVTSEQQGDPWAWAHEDTAAKELPVGAEQVVAILVAHNGARYLGRAIGALGHQELRPGLVLAVDAGSQDDSRRMLEKARADRYVDDILDAPGDEGYSAVVDSVVDNLRAAGRETGWIWLLHDDCAPRSDCLTELLRSATNPSPQDGPAILVPKLLRPKLRNRPTQVSSVGESVSLGGARVFSIEPGDIDQRQDEAADVLGGSTAGMLVRLDAWVQLGGLAPELPLFRAGLDLGWRAHQARLKVRTCPEATISHQQAGFLGLRDSVLLDDPESDDLAAGMQVRAAHARVPGFAKLWLRLMTRLKWFLAILMKDTRRAQALARANKVFVANRVETSRLAKRARAKGLVRRLPGGLLPGAVWSLKHALEGAAGTVQDRYRDLLEPETGYGIDELTSDGDEDATAPSSGPQFLSPNLGVALALIVAGVLAARPLWGLDELISLNLLPSPDTLAQAWAAWTQSDPGQAGVNAPWLGLAALGSTIVGANPAWFVVAVLALGVPVAAWSAYRVLRRLTASRLWATALAALWGILLPATGVLSGGSMGFIFVAVMLPFLASGLLRWCVDPVRGPVGLCAPGTVALTTSLLATTTPALLGFGALAAIAVGIVRRDLRGILISIIGSALPLVWWWPRLAASPGRILTGIDPLADSAGAAPNPFGMLLGRAGDAATAPWWVSGCVLGAVWLLGLVAVARSTDPETALWRRMTAALLVAAPLFGVAVSQRVVYVDGAAARPTAVPWLLIGCFAALALTASQVDGAGWPAKPLLQTWLRRLLGLVVFAGIAAGMAWWVWDGASGSLHRAADPMPSYVTAMQSSPRATRTLVVDIDGGGADVSLVDAEHPRWGDGETDKTAITPDFREEVLSLAQQFADGVASDDMATRLAAIGIGHVWVRGASESAIAALMGLPGLANANVNETTMVWTVGDVPSRYLVYQNGGGTPVGDGVVAVQTGTVPSQLVMIEPADPDWVVTVGGVVLQPADSTDGLATFELGGASGELERALADDWHSYLWEPLALLLLVLVALPGSAAAYQAARVAARRAA